MKRPTAFRTVLACLLAAGLVGAYLAPADVASAQGQAPIFLFKWGSEGSADGQFHGARGLVIDPSDNVYVADAGSAGTYPVPALGIQRFSSNGAFQLKIRPQSCKLFEPDASLSGCIDPDGAGHLELGDGQFNFILHLAHDASGNVYVVESGNARIQKFDSNGAFIAKWGSPCNFRTSEGCLDPDGPGPLEFGDGQFYCANGIAVDSADQVYVTDTCARRVQVFDSNGALLRKWGTSGSNPGQFNNTQGIDVDSADVVYIVQGSGRIQKFDRTGNFISEWGSFCSLASGFGCVDTDGAGPLEVGDGQFSNPTDVAASQGMVYVVDSENHRIQQFDSSGNFVAKWGSPGSGDGQFANPFAIDISSSGNIYVTDTFNSRVQVFAPLTPQQAAGSIIDVVNGLVDAGALKQGQGNALTAKLEAAIQQLDKGNTNAAINQLQAFINQVNALINAGILSPVEGQPLIDAANRVVDGIAAGQ